MNIKSVCTIAILVIGLIPVTLAAQTKTSGQQDTQQALERSTRRAQQRQLYDLRYQVTAGEQLYWEVEQIAKTKVSMAGFDEESSLRSRSVIRWTIDGVAENGDITFTDQLESAIEWQKVGEAEPVSYDSTQDTEVPDIYEGTAERIGKPISTTTINARGGVIEKEEHIRSAEFGMGRVTPPFPTEPVAIGTQWHIPDELQARHADDSIKTIQTRMLYTLRSVENGIATISFRREVLTPIEDPKIKSQIQQKLNQGSFQFDMNSGRIVRKLVQWNETVQGFEGDDSYLQYVGSYTMKLRTDEGSTDDSSVNNPLQPAETGDGERSSSRIRPRNGRPVIRK
ncbi:MAG: hypothetical protein ACR2NP_06145 [Pirellulaceae bacterium]